MESMAKKSCPDEEVIADFLEGRLPPEDREKLDAHLSSCDHCLEELIIAKKALRGAAESPTVPSEVTEKALRLVAERPIPVMEKSLMDSIIAGAEKLCEYLRNSFPLRWQHAPTRSSRTGAAPNLVVIRKAFKEIEAEIEVEKSGDEKAQIRIRVEGIGKNGIRVTLKKAERKITSQPLSEGYALFEDIPYGRYEIVLFTNGSELGSHTFEIRESRHGRRE